MEQRTVLIDGKPIEPGELEWRQYRKRPVVVKATRMDIPFTVETLEGWRRGDPGDWLIEGEWGLYPCDDAAFPATYELVEEENGGEDAG